MPDTGWHRTSDNLIPLPSGGELQPLRDAGTTSQLRNGLCPN
jgi:hypothetical protein